MISKDILLGTLDDLSDKVYYGNYNQLTIDLIDELIPDYINESESNWEDTCGALCYRLSTFLEVMDKTLPDYTLLNELYKCINNR